MKTRNYILKTLTILLLILVVPFGAHAADDCAKLKKAAEKAAEQVDTERKKAEQEKAKMETAQEEVNKAQEAVDKAEKELEDFDNAPPGSHGPDVAKQRAELVKKIEKAKNKLVAEQEDLLEAKAKYYDALSKVIKALEALEKALQDAEDRCAKELEEAEKERDKQKLRECINKLKQLKDDYDMDRTDDPDDREEPAHTRQQLEDLFTSTLNPILCEILKEAEAGTDDPEEYRRRLRSKLDEILKRNKGFWRTAMGKRMKEELEKKINEKAEESLQNNSIPSNVPPCDPPADEEDPSDDGSDDGEPPTDDAPETPPGDGTEPEDGTTDDLPGEDSSQPEDTADPIFDLDQPVVVSVELEAGVLIATAVDYCIKVPSLSASEEPTVVAALLSARGQNDVVHTDLTHSAHPHTQTAFATEASSVPTFCTTSAAIRPYYGFSIGYRPDERWSLLLGLRRQQQSLHGSFVHPINGSADAVQMQINTEQYVLQAGVRRSFGRGIVKPIIGIGALHQRSRQQIQISSDTDGMLTDQSSHEQYWGARGYTGVSLSLPMDWQIMLQAEYQQLSDNRSAKGIGLAITKSW